MKPIQLLGLALAAAVFAGVVTLVSMGFFQQKPAEEAQQAAIGAIIAFGITFIAVLVILALLLLAVNPADVQKTIDRPVLYDPVDEGDASSNGDAAGGDDKPRP